MAITKADLKIKLDQHANQDGGLWDTGVPLHRTNAVPLDVSSVIIKTDTETADAQVLAKNYATNNATAYSGQLITVVENDKVTGYIVQTSSHTHKVAHINADGDFVEDPVSEAPVEQLVFKSDLDYLQAYLKGEIGKLTGIMNFRGVFNSFTAANLYASNNGKFKAGDVIIISSTGTDTGVEAQDGSKPGMEYICSGYQGEAPIWAELGFGSQITSFIGGDKGLVLPKTRPNSGTALPASTTVLDYIEESDKALADFIGTKDNNFISFPENLPAKDTKGNAVKRKKGTIVEYIQEADTNIVNRLEGILEVEEQARISADSKLTQDLGTEKANREEADQELTNKLNAEATARETGDKNLNNALTKEKEDREAADKAEKEAREAADATLTANLATEITNRVNADSALTAELDKEIQDREDADTELTNKLNAEEKARKEADAELTSTIETQVNTAINNINDTLGTVFSASNTVQENVIFTEDLTLTYEFGKYKPDASGSFVLPSAGKNIQQILQDAFAQEVFEGIITSVPSVSFGRASGTSENNSGEVGTTHGSPAVKLDLNISGSYKYGAKNASGESAAPSITAASARIMLGSDTVKTMDPKDPNADLSYTHTLTGDYVKYREDEDGKAITDTYTFKGYASYNADVNRPLTNLGNFISKDANNNYVGTTDFSKAIGFIPAKSEAQFMNGASVSVKYTSFRKMFMGISDTDATIANGGLTSTFVRTLSTVSEKAAKISKEFQVPATRKYFYVAIPKSFTTTAPETYYKPFSNWESFSTVEYLGEVDVEGANSYTAATYKVYRGYSAAGKFESATNIKVTVK